MPGFVCARASNQCSDVIEADIDCEAYGVLCIAVVGVHGRICCTRDVLNGKCSIRIMTSWLYKERVSKEKKEHIERWRKRGSNECQQRQLTTFAQNSVAVSQRRRHQEKRLAVFMRSLSKRNRTEFPIRYCEVICRMKADISTIIQGLKASGGAATRQCLIAKLRASRFEAQVDYNLFDTELV